MMIFMCDVDAFVQPMILKNDIQYKHNDIVMTAVVVVELETIIPLQLCDDDDTRERYVLCAHNEKMIGVSLSLHIFLSLHISSYPFKTNMER